MAANTKTKIKNDLHASKFFDGLYSLWKSNQLCDVTLKIEESYFNVHKVVLVSCCSYFRKMFTAEQFVENNQRIIELFEVDKEAFEVILEYFYSGHIALTEDTVAEVLRTADFYDLEDVKSMCSKYLMENVTIDNCIGKYVLGAKFGLKNLENRAKLVATSHLEEVYKTREFLELDPECLSNLLMESSDSVYERNAEFIYAAVLNWTKASLENRKSSLSDLLKLIPADEVSHEFYIHNIKNEKLISEDTESLRWLLDNFSSELTFEPQPPAGSTSCPQNSIFIISISEENPSFLEYKLENCELISTLEARPDIAYYCGVGYKNSIYLTAGQYDDRNLEISYKYDINDNSWSEMDLNFDRFGAGSCILRDQLFIIGGNDSRNHSDLQSCCIYDFNSERKLVLNRMKEKRWRPGVAVYQNSLYACCGLNGKTKWSSIARCDPREGRWYEVEQFRTIKGPSSATVIRNFLYCSNCSEFVEKFDFRSNNVQLITTSNKQNLSWITSINGKLYGLHESGLQKFDDDSNEWTEQDCYFSIGEPIVITPDLN